MSADLIIQSILQTALVAMGYRPINSVFMAKPVGRSLFVVDVERREWRRLIRKIDAKTHTYNRQQIEGEDYITLSLSVRNAEAHFDNWCGVDYDFGFVTLNDLDLRL